MIAFRRDSLGQAFSDPVLDAQTSFRKLMAAMSEPGLMHVLAAGLDTPAGISPAAMIALLTLADQETPVWMDGDDAAGVLTYARFHTGCPIAETVGSAKFAVIGRHATSRPLAEFDAGDERYPDRSATIIFDCASLDGGLPRRWTGPGIQGERRVSAELPFEDLWPQIATNHARYPLGVDLILAANRTIIGLPRSVRVTALGETA